MSYANAPGAGVEYRGKSKKVVEDSIDFGT